MPSIPRLEDSFALLRAYVTFDDVDFKITHYMQKYGLPSLRITMGVVFIWSGMLNILGDNEVSYLIARTVYWFDPSWFVPFFGAWGVVIGVCFLSRSLVRAGILLVLPQLFGALLPFVLLPDVVFEDGFPTLSLEGLYLLRNVVLIAAAIAVGSTVRDVKFDNAFVERHNYNGRNKEG
jgi:uncharacterized membrane protein YkgB